MREDAQESASPHSIERWNSMVLLAFGLTIGATAGLVVGFASADGCADVKDAPWGCLEFLFARYQTLFGAAIAIGTAVYAAGPVRKQLLEARRQSAISSAASLRVATGEMENEIRATGRVLKSLRGLLQQTRDDLASGRYEKYENEVSESWRKFKEYEDEIYQRTLQFPDEEFLPARRKHMMRAMRALWRDMDDFNPLPRPRGDFSVNTTAELHAFVDDAKLLDAKMLNAIGETEAFVAAAELEYRSYWKAIHRLERQGVS